MPSWADLRHYARSKFTLEDDEDELFSIVFGLSDGRSHKVVVRPQSMLNADLIEFRTAVCREAELAPHAALLENAKMPLGALALEDGMYLLTYRLPLSHLDIAEFELPLGSLARSADELERAHTKVDEF